MALLNQEKQLYLQILLSQVSKMVSLLFLQSWKLLYEYNDIHPTHTKTFATLHTHTHPTYMTSPWLLTWFMYKELSASCPCQGIALTIMTWKLQDLTVNAGFQHSNYFSPTFYTVLALWSDFSVYILSELVSYSLIICRLIWIIL